MHVVSLKQRLMHAFIEDGAHNDVSTKLLPDVHRKMIRARITSKQSGIFCGAFLFKHAFKLEDKKIRVHVMATDGQKVKKGKTLAKIYGRADVILSAERTVLNLVSHLSGISTLTRQYVNAVRGTKAVILDTRKTIPLWRDVEKFAVKCGGGHNHRFSLEDAIMVKDNHHQFLEEMGLKVDDVYSPKNRARFTRHLEFFEVEAKSFRDVWEGIRANADYILLDNMADDRLVLGSMRLIEAARKARKSKFPLIEVSGNMTIEKAKKFARMGVDRISVGAITHSAPAFDVSMEVY